MLLLLLQQLLPVVMLLIKLSMQLQPCVAHAMQPKLKGERERGRRGESEE